MTKRTTKTTCCYRVVLVTLFGIFIAGMAATFFASGMLASRVTDPDYYRNGLNYDRTRSGARNPGLKWTLTATLAGRDLLVRVCDEKGAPVAGGSLSLHPGKKTDSSALPLQLAESAPGVFRTSLPVSAQSELQGVLLFTRGEASASQRVVFFN
ncbi:FixH superfamily protein [Citrifermentans bemidjiense Bem]|uniref:FixH superfamily protein n=1 Tax=Citrifermentans bemidjiense (strain ATCC BAA-1014 / DSM 16622 / JCM 12645 / Bem) TaxID=404380 RepID=B5EHP1_CITBB|nr:FixH family protein [Citrifermentans bemidjiense]ACH38251.1 FixH superfamily protein [Citrifermentans bemidjiense Bem]